MTAFMRTTSRRTSTVGSHGAPCTDSQEQHCEGYGASQGASGGADACGMLASWANVDVTTSTGHDTARAYRIHGLQCSCSERKTAATRCGAATARATELTVPSCGMPSMMPLSTPCSPRAPLGTRPALLKARGGRSDSRMDAFACLRFVRIHAFRPGVRMVASLGLQGMAREAPDAHRCVLSERASAATRPSPRRCRPARQRRPSRIPDPSLTPGRGWGGPEGCVASHLSRCRSKSRSKSS